MASGTKLSVDIDNNCVRIYRITRDDAVEMNVFELPDLVEMERFNLTYIPADCCCVTCGTTFQKDCDVFVQHRSHLVHVILSHDVVHVGRGSLQSQACEPVILRAGKPNRSLDIAANDALIPERNIGLCPSILNAAGELRKKVFETYAESDPDQLQVGGPGPKEQSNSPQGDEESMESRALKQLSWGYFQTTNTNEEFKSSNQELMTQLGTVLEAARRKAVKQPVSQILNFKDLKHDTRLTPEQVESAVNEFESDATSALALPPDNDWIQQAWDGLKATKAGKSLPFDSWAEVKEMVREMEEDLGMRSIFEKLWPPGESGSEPRSPSFSTHSCPEEAV